MSLEKASIQWSAKQIKGMVMSGKISFENIVQRSYCWEAARKTKLIESMILGYPIPVIYAKRSEDSENLAGRGTKCYDILDGKQRLSTIKEYLNDEFALTFVPEFTFTNDAGESRTVNITGRKFSELSEDIRDYLSTLTFTITYFDNLTKEEERELFKRLNNGKPLSAKSRLLASCNDIEHILDIGKHPLFDIMLSEKSKDNKNQVTILMKMYMMMTKDIDEVSFASVDFNPVVEETTIDAEDTRKLIGILEYIYNTYEYLYSIDEKQTCKKLITETHMVALVPYVMRAIVDRITPEIFASWITSFFNTVDKKDTSNSEKYNSACGSGNARHYNILSRHEALGGSYEEFFSE